MRGAFCRLLWVVLICVFLLSGCGNTSFQRATGATDAQAQEMEAILSGCGIQVKSIEDAELTIGGLDATDLEFYKITAKGGDAYYMMVNAADKSVFMIITDTWETVYE